MADRPPNTSPDTEDAAPERADAPAQPAQPAQKGGGFFARLFGGGPALDVRFVPVIGDERDEETRRIIAALDASAGIRCRMARGAFKVDAEKTIDEQIAKIRHEALKTIAKTGADLLIWGEMAANREAIDLHFVAPENAAGFCHGISCTAANLTLPLPLDNALYPALVTVTLTAATLTGNNPKTKARKDALRAALGPALEQAIDMAKAPPRFMAPHDRATLQGCLANAVAKAGQIWNDMNLFRAAVDLYQIAMRGLSRDVGGAGAVVAGRNLGVVLEALADRDKAEQKQKGTKPEAILRGYQNAAAAYEAALDNTAPDASPIDAAWVQFRLGQTYYKADILAGETALMKKATPAFQNALKGLPAVALPPNPPPAGATPMQLAAQTSLALIRAEALNALAETLQHMGGEDRDEKLIGRAIDTYRAALDIRTQERVPQLWAATQNNLGAAYFLLGRISGGEEHFQAAQTAFSSARDAYAKLGMPKRAALAEKHLSYVDDHLNTDPSQNPGLPMLDWEIDDDDARP